VPIVPIVPEGKMKETHAIFFFYDGEMICKRYTEYDTPEDIFKYHVEPFFRYSCEKYGFRSQWIHCDLAIRACVSDLKMGMRLSKKENQMVVMAYMVLWKFGKIPYEDIIILKRKRKKKIDRYLK